MKTATQLYTHKRTTGRQRQKTHAHTQAGKHFKSTHTHTGHFAPLSNPSPATRAERSATVGGSSTSTVTRPCFPPSPAMQRHTQQTHHATARDQVAVNHPCPRHIQQFRGNALAAMSAMHPDLRADGHVGPPCVAWERKRVEEGEQRKQSTAGRANARRATARRANARRANARRANARRANAHAQQIHAQQKARTTNARRARRSSLSTVDRGRGHRRSQLQHVDENQNWHGPSVITRAQQNPAHSHVHHSQRSKDKPPSPGVNPAGAQAASLHNTQLYLRNANVGGGRRVRAGHQNGVGGTPAG